MIFWSEVPLMIESMQEFTIPARYNPVIDHFRKKEQFDYLKFDGNRFKVPLEMLMEFYRDLKKDLPQEDIVRKLSMGTGAQWDIWEKDLEETGIPGLPEVKERLKPERMEALLCDEEEIGTIGLEEGEKDIELTAKIVGATLFILLILLISLLFFLIPSGSFGFLPRGSPFELLDILSKGSSNDKEVKDGPEE
ncbi:MAG: hypothetical protein ACMUFK_04945 [Thermoplasmatota archaeon]